MNVEMPDGTIIEDVPEGTTQSQLLGKYNKYKNPVQQPKIDELPQYKGPLGKINQYTDAVANAATRPLLVTDEAGAALKSIPALFNDDETFSQAYNRNFSKDFSQDSQLREKFPVSSTLAELATGIRGASGIANAARSIPGASALSRFAQNSPKLASAGLGSLSSGVYAAGTGEGSVEKRLQDAAIPAAVGFGIGGVAPPILSAASNAGSKLLSSIADKVDPRIIGSNAVTKVSRDISSKLPSSAEPVTADQIRKQASKAYNRADELGGTLTSDFTDDFIDNLQFMRPQTKEGAIFAGQNEVTKVLDRFENLRGKPITLQGAQEIDEALGDAIDNLADRTTGKLTKEGKKLYDVQSTFREMIENADQSKVTGSKEGFEALKEGRKLWAKSAKLADIEKIISRAEMSDQPANAIKSGFRTLANNPNRMKGFSSTEQKAIKEAAKTGVVSEGLRAFASRLFGIGMAVQSGPLGYLGGKGAEMAARGVRERIQLGKASDLAQLLATGSSRPKSLVNPLFTGLTSSSLVNSPVATGGRR